MHTRSHSDGGAVVARAIPVVGGADALEAVSVDNKRAPANAASKEVVSSVANDEAQVVVSGEVDTRLDVGNGLGCDVQDRIVAQRAAACGISGRAAGVIGEVGPEASGGQLDSVTDGQSTCSPHAWCAEMTYWNCSLGNPAVTAAHLAASYVLTVPRGPWKVL